MKNIKRREREREKVRLKDVRCHGASQTLIAYNIIQSYSMISDFLWTLESWRYWNILWLSDNKTESSEVRSAKKNSFAKVSWSICLTFDYSNKKFTFSPSVCLTVFRDKWKKNWEEIGTEGILLGGRQFYDLEGQI